MRLRTRLMIAFQSLAVIALIAGGVGVWQISQLNRAARQVSDIATPHLYAIQDSQKAAIEADLILTAIGARIRRTDAVDEVYGLLDDADASVAAILDGGVEILNQVPPPAEDDDIVQPLRQMRAYLNTMRSLAEQQMNSMERFNEFSSALEGSFRNARLAYTDAADLAEQAIETNLLEQRAQMEQTARTGMITLGGATLLSLLVAFLLAASFASMMVRRVRAVLTASSALAEGDFSTTVEYTGNDELSQLGTDLNHAIEQLGTVVGTVIARVTVLTDTGTQLAASSDETARAVQEINGIVETSREQNDDLVANVTETSAIIEQMARNIDSLDASVQQQSSVIEQSSASIEEMISSVESISSVSTRAREQLERLTGAAETGRASLDQQEAMVSQMSTAGRSLQEANQLIAGVASQTNLLAMNAAIEAAHAGDAGRGFAVVADEIRKLAETTSEQSNQVKRDLKSMETLIAQLVEGSATSSHSFSDIQTALEDVRHVFDEIYSAMEEQRTGGSEILEALSQMREMTTTVHGGSSEMKSGNEQMLEAIRNVNDITQRSREAMQRISDGMETIASAMADITSVSDLNRTQISDIIAATDRFVLPGEKPTGPSDDGDDAETPSGSAQTDPEDAPRDPDRSPSAPEDPA